MLIIVLIFILTIIISFFNPFIWTSIIIMGNNKIGGSICLIATYFLTTLLILFYKYPDNKNNRCIFEDILGSISKCSKKDFTINLVKNSDKIIPGGYNGK